MQAKEITCNYTKPFRDASEAGKKDHKFKIKYDILIVAVSHPLHLLMTGSARLSRNGS